MSLDRIPLAITPERRLALEAMCDLLADALGDDLHCLMVYGEATRTQGVLPPLADLEVLLVAPVDRDKLERMAPAVAAARRAGRISVLVLTPEELSSATDVFPIKFLEMQRTGRPIIGDDPLTSIQIDRVHLRLRCEQELRDIGLKLRRRYLLHRLSRGDLSSTISQFLPLLTRALRYLLVLRGEQTEDLDQPGILENACTALGLDQAPVVQLMAAVHGTEDEPVLRDLVGFLMKLSMAAAAVADQLR